MSEANSQTQSKDLMFVGGATSDARNFRIAIRFFDEHDTECHLGPSREAAEECSPRRKPWDKEKAECQPRRGERKCLLVSSLHGATS